MTFHQTITTGSKAEDIRSRALNLSDLLKVIDHMHDMEGANGLSAVIAAAQNHVEHIMDELDEMADKVALKDVRTPVMTLFHKWLELRDNMRVALDALPKGADETPFYAPVDNLEEQIAQTTAVTAADFAVKMIVSTCEGTISGDWKTDPVWAEARKLVGMKEAV